MPRLSLTDNCLYAITDSEKLRGELLVHAVDEVLAGGCHLVQYRDKTSDHSRRLSEAQQLQKLCCARGAKLIINDDIELARHCGAAGVHLGQGDSPIDEARARLGDQALVGITCHASLELAQQALAAGADYIAFGRFFPSRTKPLAPAANLALLGRARVLWPETCIVAIGGVDQGNACQLLERGADYLAICSDLFQSSSPSQYASTFNHLTASHGSHTSPGTKSRATNHARSVNESVRSSV